MKPKKHIRPIPFETMVLQEWFWDLWDYLEKIYPDVYYQKDVLVVSSLKRSPTHNYSFYVQYFPDDIIQIGQSCSERKQHHIDEDAPTRSRSFSLRLNDPEIFEKIGKHMMDWLRNPHFKDVYD